MSICLHSLALLLTSTIAFGQFSTLPQRATGLLVVEEDAEGNRSVHSYREGHPSGVLLPEDLERLIIASQSAEAPDSLAAADRLPTPTRTIGQYIEKGPEKMRAIEFGVGANGKLTAFREPELNATFLTLDGHGNPIRIDYPHGERIEIGYDSLQNQTSFLRPATGASWTAEYGAVHNGLTVWRGLPDQAFRYEYDSIGNLEKYTSAEGRTATFDYDEAGMVFSHRTIEGPLVQYGYDAVGNTNEITVGEGSESIQAQFSSDALGRLTTIVDPLGGERTMAYDAEGRLQSVEYEDGQTVSFELDGNGNVTSIKPFLESGSHEYEYNGLDLPKSYRPPSVSGFADYQQLLAYDDFGQISDVSEIVNNSETRRIEIEWTPFRDIAREEDLVVGTRYDRTYLPGTWLKASSVSGDDVSLHYGYLGSLPVSKQWSGPFAGSVVSTLDATERLATQSVAGGETIGFEFDRDDLATKAGDLIIVRDVATGLETSSALGQTVLETSYNVFAFPSYISAKFEGVEQIGWQYSYNKKGLVTEKRERIDGVETLYTYEYDAGYRLASVKRSGVTIETYDYDDNRNRMSGPTGEPYSYNARDQLVIKNGNTYTYSGDGSLASIEDDSGVTNFKYDFFSVLKEVELPDGRLVEYLHDGEKNRVGKKVDGLQTQGFLYADPLRVVAELDGENQVVSQFVYDPHQLTPSYMIKGDKTYRIISDLIGSPRLVSDSETGEAVQRMDYDSFGNVLLDTNPGFQPFGFAGGLWDRDTRLLRFWQRDYDPRTGRFTTPDPLLFDSADPNLYTYAHGDPINYIDRLGLADSWIMAIRIRGTVQVKRAGTNEWVTIDGPVVLYDLEDRIRTLDNSVGRLRTSGGSLVTMGPKTDVSFQEFNDRTGRLHIKMEKSKGGIRAWLTKFLGGGRSFQVETPNAVL